MANLSNINGKFVVEQTTGFVGIGTTDPGFLIEAAGTNAELALNASSIYRIRSTASDEFIITKNGVGDRLTISGGGNATFANEITSGDDINSGGKVVVNNVGADKKIAFRRTGGNNWSIEHDASQLYFYNETSSKDILLMKNGGQIMLGEYGSGTFTGTTAYTLAVDSSGNIIETTDGGGTVKGTGTATRVAFWSASDTISSNANLYWDNSNDRLGLGTTTPQKALHIEGASGASASQLLVCGPSDTTGDTAGILLRAEGGEGDSALRAKGGIFFERNATGNGLGSLHFCNNNSNNNDSADLTDSHMTILGNGNVGINETAPGTLLSLAGGADESIIQLKCTKNDSSWSGERIGGINFFSEDGSGPGAAVRGSINYIATSTSGGSTAMVFKVGDNTEKMRIANGGSVGIGTDSPTTKLAVKDSQDASFDSGIGVIRSNSSQTGYINMVGGAMNINAPNAVPIKFRDGGNTNVTIGGDGNVGIGVTSPDNALDIDSSYTNSVHIQGTGSRNLFSYHDTGGVGWATGSGTNYTNLIYLEASNNNILLFTNSTEKMRITSAGNVGIGNTSPAYPLDILRGSEIQARFIGSSTGHTQGAILLQSGTADTPQARGQGVYRFNEGNDDTWYTGTAYANTDKYIWARKASTTSFDSGAAQVTYAMMTLTNDGKLGIGTTSPTFNVGSGLEISRAGVATLRVTDSDGTTGSTELLQADADGYLFTRQSGALIFGTNDTERMRITSTGNIEVKTTNGEINFDSGNGYVQTTTGSTSLVFGTNSTERMRVHSSGNVGIGTTGPNSILHLSSSGPTELTISDTNAASNTKNYGIFSDTGKLHIRRLTDAYSGYTPTMTFNQDKVGINKSSPTYFLDVIGTNEDILKLHNSTDGLDSLISFTNPGGTLGRIQGLDNGGLQFDTGNNAGGVNSNVVYMSNDGNVGLNTTSPSSYNSHGRDLVVVRSGNCGISIISGQSSSGSLLFGDGTGGTAAYRGKIEYDHSNDQFEIRTAATVNGLFSSTGTLTVSGDVIAYGSPSDKRLKENIKPIKSALDKVSKLQGVTFNWKESGSILELKKDVGFIAQDVQKVMPELVRENKDGMLSMRHQGIAPILLEAIKELKAEIEELKKHSCDCKK